MKHVSIMDSKPPLWATFIIQNSQNYSVKRTIRSHDPSRHKNHDLQTRLIILHDRMRNGVC